MKNKLIYLFTDARVRNKQKLIFFIIIYMNLKNMRMRNKINLVYLFIH
jgi:hypothetical protein